GTHKVTEKKDGAKATKDIASGEIIYQNPDGTVDKDRSVEPVSDAQVKADAEAIWTATKAWASYGGAGTDKKTLDAILKNASEAEKQKIDEYLFENYGWHLEDLIKDEISEGPELIETLGYLHHKDEDDRAYEATTIAKDLAEIQQSVLGRDRDTIEAELRDIVAKKDAAGVKKLEDDYRAKTGRDLWEDIANN